jgi:predicted metal-dependent hydrolase
MQLVLPLVADEPAHQAPAPRSVRPSPDAQPPAPSVAGPVVFVRHRRARRYVLRVLEDGTLRVTMPRWGSKREALAFAQQQDEWVQRQRALRRAESPSARPWGDGASVLLDGVPTALRVARGDDGALVVRVGDETVPAPAAADPADVRPWVQRWLRRRAGTDLPTELQALAAAHKITVTKITVRNQQSRWGSCSRRGSIALNWRLVQAPPFVRTYVLVHELMHRRELNHSPRFWAHVKSACPDTDRARHWLRHQGRQLF